MKRKIIYLFVALALMFSLMPVMGVGTAAAAVTTAAVSPLNQTVLPGAIFTVDIVVDPQVPIAGVQADVSFDPSLLSANDVVEGNLLLSSGCATFGFKPYYTINNTAGTITNIFGTILGSCYATSSGTFVRITFTAKTAIGASPINLLNVMASDHDANSVPISVTNGSVTVEAPALPTTVYVDAARPDDSGDGTSWATAKKTIQAGVTAVDAGGTIHVAAGTYNEAITIGTANLTLKSETALGAIIKPTTAGTNAIDISADGVTVDGFEIDGTTVCKNGIRGWETSGLTIKNNKIHGAVNTWDGCGILLFSWGNGGTVYNNLIQNNEVYDTGRMGIAVMNYGSDNKYAVTSGNTITGNTVHDVWQKATAWDDGGGGIQINVGKNCAITNNEVYDVRDGQRGIYMFGSAAGNTITGNTLRDNPIGIALWISGEQTPSYINWGGETPTSPQVHLNNIYGNSLYGAKSYNIQGTSMVMDATNNWWGDPTGPLDPSDDTVTGGWYNPSGQGDPVSDQVKYDPYQTQESGVTGGEGCFIATAAYGSYLDSHVDTLRSFRDQYLKTNPIGSAFVSLYYKVSPPMAAFIDEHPTLKPVVRAGLMPAVAMSSVALNTTLAEKAVILVAMALFTTVLIMWLRRRTRRLERR